MMSSKIYAVAHIGDQKLLVGDASQLSAIWPPIKTRLERGSYPHRRIQQAWNHLKDQRYFTFHLSQDIKADPDIVVLPVTWLLQSRLASAYSST